MSSLLKNTILLLSALLLATSCIKDDIPDGYSNVKVGDKLPYFSVTTESGSRISTGDLAGKASVIVFFNTTCPDCRKELPVLQELHEQIPGLTILCIAREESEDDISRYWKENGLTLTYSPQSDRAVYNLFATEIIPRTYIADPSTVVIAEYGDKDIPTLDELVSVLQSIK